MTGKRSRSAAGVAHVGVSSDVLEELCTKGLVQRTFLRLPPERRAAVIDGAVAEASVLGPAQLNIKAVARRASIPVGSLYQYFGSREALVGFVAAVAAGQLSMLLGAHGGQLAELPLAQGLRIYLDEALAWSRREPTLLRLYAVAAYGLAIKDQASADSSADVAVVEPIAQAMQQVVRAMVLAAKQRGELRDGIDAENACRLLNVLLIAVIDAALLPGLNVYYRLHESPKSLTQLLDGTIDLLTRGVLAPGKSITATRKDKA